VREEKSPKKTLGSISMDGIAYFFTGNNPNFILFIMLLVEEYKLRRMYSFRVVVNSSELFGSFEATKMLYTANLFLPLARLAEITFLPFLVFIRVLNP